jgi:hypothetical protein
MTGYWVVERNGYVMVTAVLATTSYGAALPASRTQTPK